MLLDGKGSPVDQKCTTLTTHTLLIVTYAP